MNQTEAVKAIRVVRNKIIKLDAKRNKLFNRLCRKFRINPDDANGLFDYIFNGYGTASDAWLADKPADARPKKS
jgi:hypothetical protein